MQVHHATHDVAFKRIKSAIADLNNLAYFDVKKEIEIQCDASLKCIGVCLLQEGKPVYFASKSLTETESRYSNIEREMLRVVFALTRVHQYSFGRHVTVISDHKPLEPLNLKNLNLYPPCLQLMLAILLLAIQIYNDLINNIIITHSERALFNLNARVEARGIIVPKAVGRGYYGPERRHKVI